MFCFLFCAVHITNFSLYGAKGNDIRMTVLLLKLCNVFIRVSYTTLLLCIFLNFLLKKEDPKQCGNLIYRGILHHSFKFPKEMLKWILFPVYVCMYVRVYILTCLYSYPTLQMVCSLTWQMFPEHLLCTGHCCTSA